MTPLRPARRLALPPLALTLLAACSQIGTMPAGLEPQASYYVAQDLGTLGGSESQTRDVSADGKTVVGFSEVPPVNHLMAQHAFVWTEAGGMKDLGVLDGRLHSWAEAVTDDGQTVVGGSFVPSGAVHAFVWTEATGMRGLGTLGGWSSGAAGVSADGRTVVGTSEYSSDPGQHAFVWTEAGGMRDLGTLGGMNSYGRGVSADGGVAVGYSLTADDAAWRAFVWTEAGGMRDLGTLGGSYSEAFAVSADGQTVVGTSATVGDAGQHAFLWTPAGGMRDLGTLGGGVSIATGISADGQTVVGDSVDADGNSRAFVWTEMGGMQRLDAAGGPAPRARAGGLQSLSAAGGETSAQDVADGGRVVVGNYAPAWSEQQRAVRWTLSAAPAPVESAYLIDFERAPANAFLYSVRLGGGVVHRGGGTPSPATVPVVGKRRSGSAILSAHLAKVVKVYGSKRLVVSSPGTNSPAPQGGRVKLTFTNLNPEGVTLTSLALSNLTARGAYLTLYYADGTSAKRVLGTTKAGGSLVVAPNAKGLAAVDVFAPNAFAVDDVAFTVTR